MHLQWCIIGGPVDKVYCRAAGCRMNELQWPPRSSRQAAATRGIHTYICFQKRWNLSFAKSFVKRCLPSWYRQGSTGRQLDHDERIRIPSSRHDPRESSSLGGGLGRQSPEYKRESVQITIGSIYIGKLDLFFKLLQREDNPTELGENFHFR